MNLRPVDFGFGYGPVDVTRMMSDDDKGWVIIGIGTAKHKNPIQVYVTKTGKVRVFSSDGEWTKPVRKK